MARLSLWMPPFSPDYSGAAAVLFDLHTVTAMHDGSGCTGNYTSYDEARWYGSKSGIFCSGLRRMDAILGDDEKLIKKMEAAAQDLEPELLCLIGSPVPMVIGADLKGIAAELEARTGIPSMGIDTTGTAYYDKGAYQTASALMDRFTKEIEPTERKKRRLNILGALPMDFGKGENIEALKEILIADGFEIGLTFAMGYTLEQLMAAASASVNLAISRFGYQLAVYMEKKFQIPYVCGFPAGEEQTKQMLEALQETEKSGISVILKESLSCPQKPLESLPTEIEKKILILGEEVMANAVRNGLETMNAGCKVVVGCLYGREPALAREEDLDLKTEKQIKETMNRPEYGMILADPFFKVLLDADAEKQWISLSQYAVSSKLGEKDAAVLAGSRFEQWLAKIKDNRRMKQ